jgi:hypothetical protein
VREQRRERPASESATTRRTFCADAAVCTHRKGPEWQGRDANVQLKVVALSTSRSTLAPTAVTLAPVSGSVRRTPPSFNPPIPESTIAANPSLRLEKKHSEDQVLTHNYRQLGREGQEEKDHWFRPHAVPEDRPPQVQQRLPDRYPQGRSRCQAEQLSDLLCANWWTTRQGHDGVLELLAKGRWALDMERKSKTCQPLGTTMLSS